MTEEQVRQETCKLINESVKRMHENLNRAINCNALNLEDCEDETEISRIIMVALLRIEADNCHVARRKQAEIDEIYNNLIY